MQMAQASRCNHIGDDTPTRTLQRCNRACFHGFCVDHSCPDCNDDKPKELNWCGGGECVRTKPGAVGCSHVGAVPAGESSYMDRCGSTAGETGRKYCPRHQCHECNGNKKTSQSLCGGSRCFRKPDPSWIPTPDHLATQLDQQHVHDPDTVSGSTLLASSVPDGQRLSKSLEALVNPDKQMHNNGSKSASACYPVDGLFKMNDAPTTKRKNARSGAAEPLEEAARLSTWPLVRHGEKSALSERLAIGSYSLRPLSFGNLTQQKKEVKIVTFTAASSHGGTRSVQLSRKPIGRGTYTKVCVGMLDDGGHVAVKEIVLAPHEAESKIKREFELLKTLKHNNLATIIGYALGDKTDDGRQFLIFLEYVATGSLQTALETFGALPESIAVRFITQALHGLEFLHSQGILHRNVKPHNMLLDPSGVIKLSDFGEYKELLSTCKQLSMHLIGPAVYMSPEAFDRKYSRGSDIWSLGMTIIHMLTGKPPWYNVSYGHVAELGNHIKHRDPEIPSTLSGSCQRFLKLCFARDDKTRPTCTALLNDPWLTSGSSGHPTSGSSAETESSVSLHAGIPSQRSHRREPVTTHQDTSPTMPTKDLQELEQLLRADPNDHNLHCQFAQRLASSQPERAQMHFKKAVKIHSEYLTTHSALAQQLLHDSPKVSYEHRQGCDVVEQSNSLSEKNLSTNFKELC